MIFAIFTGVGFDLLYRARNLSICDVVFCCGTVFCVVFSIGVIFVIVCGVWLLPVNVNVIKSATVVPVVESMFPTCISWDRSVIIKLFGSVIISHIPGVQCAYKVWFTQVSLKS